MKNFIRQQLSENLQRILTEETYRDLFDFLDQGQKKMTNGTAYYVASMDSSMNKFIMDDSGIKVPNPMYGRLFKHTRFMFPWADTYKRAMERKGEGRELSSRSGTFEKVTGYDVLERGKSGLYLPILPSGSEYKYVVVDGGESKVVSKEEVLPYLRPSSPSGGGPVDFRLLIVDKIAKLTGGGNVWINPEFKGSYMGMGVV